MNSTDRIRFFIGSVIVFLLLIFFYVLIGFERLEFYEYGLRYDTMSATVDLENDYGPGLHYIGAFSEFLTFPSHIITISIPDNSMTVRSRDQLPITMAVRVHYQLKRKAIADIFTRFLQNYEEVFVKMVHHSSTSLKTALASSKLYMMILTPSLETVGATVPYFDMINFAIPNRVQDAINEARVASKAIQQAVYNQATTRISMEQQLSVADIDAEINLQLATADATATLLAAEARANATINVNTAKLESRLSFKDNLNFNNTQLFTHLKHRIIKNHQVNRIVMTLPKRFIENQ
ncbi:hypothetical protein GEMRC1_012575 [Eukaryota sp. GEM-RC1]